MTEESFQQCRKVMRKANHIRGMITTAKRSVEKWTRLEAFYKQELKEANAIAASKNLDKAMKSLQDWRDKFDLMKFPDSDIVVIKKKTVQCEGCGTPIAEGNTYCGECLCEDDCDY